MKNLFYYIFRPLGALIGVMPRFVQLLIGEVLYLALYKIARYRVGVTTENIARSLPHLNEKEQKTIRRKFYRHLSDVFVETIALSAMSENNLRKRMVFTNADQIETLTKGQSWICAMAHYGSWEYTISYALHTKHDGILAVYHTLQDAGADKFYKQMRQRFGAEPVPMEAIGRKLLLSKRDGKTYGVALIADQNPPPSLKRFQWVDFLSQKSLFFGGTEILARKMNLPVMFLRVDKVKRGYYTATFVPLYDGTENIEEGEIIKRYSGALEQMILERPELWMWSHKRWKRKYPFND